MVVDKLVIIKALKSLNIIGCDVAVHSSFKSLGIKEYGPRLVVESLLETCRTVIVPTFCENGRTNPPSDDRPKQNGWDYENYRIDANNGVFSLNDFGTDSDMNTNEMGIIPYTLMRTKDSIRSEHPSVSWCGIGGNAKKYLCGHDNNDPNYPMKKLYENNGKILLIGVDLCSCTAIHLAEEYSGRRPFIRWIEYSDGIVRRVREYGCSNGFNKLQDYLNDDILKLTINNCVLMACDIRALVDKTVKIINNNPKITLCGNKECRCVDAVNGGPV